jgi:hypothetical protein
MKTYAIEVQRVKAMSNNHGVITARVDAMVQPAPRQSADDDSAPQTLLSMSEETARVVFLLLKAQLAEFDKRKARSQR